MLTTGKSFSLSLWSLHERVSFRDTPAPFFLTFRSFLLDPLWLGLL